MRRACLVLLWVLAMGAAEVRAQPVVGEAVAAHIREIRARNPGLRDDAFAKMGGSSVESTAFLHCFATPYVDLGDHGELAVALDYFHAGPRSSFDRNSKATGVSWNLKYVLGGRPANFREELAETRARWALILFGANDAQNENERVYLQRLVYLIEQLESMGVVPVLGAAPPRRSPSKDRWIRRFNAITKAVAEHWALPFIDYYAALDDLPRKGLAGDGVHPNVLHPGGLRAACQLTAQGLRYGNNVRNLLTLQMLDALRRVVDGGRVTCVADAGVCVDAGRVADAGALSGAGTGALSGAGTGTGAGTVSGTGTGTVPETDFHALTVEDLPFSALIHKSALPPLASLPARCGVPAPGSGVYRTRIELEESARLRVSALALDGDRPQVFWVRIEPDGSERCVRRRAQTLELDVPAGMWDLIVEASARADSDDRMLLLLDREPR